MGIVGLRVNFASRNTGFARAWKLGFVGLLAGLIYLAVNFGRSPNEPAAARVIATIQTAPLTQTVASVSARARHEVALPWGILFGSLERAAAAGVTLVSLDSKGPDGSAAIDAQAIDVRAMARYVAQLADDGLNQVEIVRQHPVEQTDRVHFSMALHWAAADSGSSEPAGSLAVADLATTSELPSLSAEWLAMAKMAGLLVRSVDHARAQDTDNAQYTTLEFEVEGDYRAAREFINRAVASRAGIALIRFSLASVSESEAQRMNASLRGHIALRVFLREVG